MLTLLGFFSLSKNSMGMVVSVLLFVVFFEFSSGPIVYLYNAEIMKDKGYGVANFLNWFMGLTISATTPLLLKKFNIG